ncbi:DUF4271 domain-containing protein [Lentiprolixibacter aurantiacus]|uniref:DUF4271 domain-containing protein n=1 Tax=Lentiprolixibacter aurantiacus TaxID=2993939 RepID=A0AAE3MJF5_9FLAO|nr:DUF4271 domain-containing protein [Lentiprolixibacter aurantiacus]MCX2718222.1 DUF4271 domain-containing protein [Lentiprolixibacter aurantiacus]
MDPIYRSVTSLDWITAIILLSLLILVIAKRLFSIRFTNFVILPFNSKYVFLYNKKDRLNHGFHLFLTVFQLLNLSLYLFWIVNIFNGPDRDLSPLSFLMILGLVLIFFLTKIILQLGNAVVFDNFRIISEFIFKKVSYLNYSGGVMLIANVIFTYIDPGALTVFYISFVLILLINIVGWVNIIKSRQKFILSYFFYFILYLCALEISPLVIIAHYLNA